MRPGVRSRRAVGAMFLVACLAMAGVPVVDAQRPPAGPRASGVTDLGYWDGGTCPSVLFVGARGSGQGESDHDGLGVQVYRAYAGFVQELKDAVRGRHTVAYRPLDYEAWPVTPDVLIAGFFQGESPAYADSRDGGVQSLFQQVAAYKAECEEHDTVLVLAGFSQGADVVSLAVSSEQWPWSNGVAAAILMGNPYLSSSDGSRKIGQPVGEQSGGRLGQRDIPGWMQADTIQACAMGDGVCDRDVWNAVTTLLVHAEEAYGGFAAAAGRWAANHIVGDLEGWSEPAEVGGGGGADIAVVGDVVHAVYEVADSGGHTVYYRRSTNGGKTWGSPVEMASSSGSSASEIVSLPAIAASGPRVCVVWVEAGRVYYRRSVTAGTTWKPTQTIRRPGNPAYDWFAAEPDVAVHRGEVHVAWLELRSEAGNPGASSFDRVETRRSFDGGRSWEALQTLSDWGSWGANRHSPSLAVTPKAVHVLWSETGTDSALYYRRSTTRGVGWEQAKIITSDGEEFHEPDGFAIAASGKRVFIAWFNHDLMAKRILMRRSGNHGEGFLRPTVVTRARGGAYLAMAGLGTDVAIAWSTDADSSGTVWAIQSESRGVGWFAKERVHIAVGASGPLATAIAESGVHIVFEAQSATAGPYIVHHTMSP